MSTADDYHVDRFLDIASSGQGVERLTEWHKTAYAEHAKEIPADERDDALAAIIATIDNENDAPFGPIERKAIITIYGGPNAHDLEIMRSAFDVFSQQYPHHPAVQWWESIECSERDELLKKATTE